ncbi:hypothetical protein [Pseudomonas phage vB_Pae_SG_WM_Sew_P3]
MSHINDRTPGHGVLDSSLANLIRTFLKENSYGFRCNSYR